MSRFLSQTPEYRKKYRLANPHQYILRQAKGRAKQLGIPFDLVLADIVIPRVCPVLGVPLVWNTQYAPSIDRIDNSLGYVRGNIQIISFKANRMKADATSEELERFARWVMTFS